LDEATAHIDSETEHLLQYATEQLTKGRTSIIIAHRLATIQRANRIVVIDKGQLVESGNHEALLEKKGYYARLYQKQFKEQDRSSA
jgi:ATP-binding cassette subfamily B protein